MPYVGDELAPLFDAGPAEAALYRMAEVGGDAMVEWTVRNTPIGGRFAGSGSGGNLRTSWYQLPVERARDGALTGWQSGAATDVGYAPDVEHGTGLWGPDHAPYVIVPKKPGGWLHWIDPKTGRDVFAKRVVHPGSPGQHMVAIAAARVEFEFERGGLMDGVLREWEHATEAQAD